MKNKLTISKITTENNENAKDEFIKFIVDYFLEKEFRKVDRSEKLY